MPSTKLYVDSPDVTSCELQVKFLVTKNLLEVHNW